MGADYDRLLAELGEDVGEGESEAGETGNEFLDASDYGAAGIDPIDDEAAALGQMQAIFDSAKAERDAAAAEQADFARDMEKVAQMSPDYQPPHVDSDVEKAAVLAASDIEWFKEALRADIAKSRTAGERWNDVDPQARAEAPESKTDISTLSRADFNSLVKAVSMGMSEDQWLAERGMS